MNAYEKEWVFVRGPFDKCLYLGNEFNNATCILHDKNLNC